MTLIEVDAIPAPWRWAFNALLAVVAVWALFLLGYFLLFDVVNAGPGSGFLETGTTVAIACWIGAICVRWGLSLTRRE